MTCCPAHVFCCYRLCNIATKAELHDSTQLRHVMNVHSCDNSIHDDITIDFKRYAILTTVRVVLSTFLLCARTLDNIDTTNYQQDTSLIDACSWVK